MPASIEARYLDRLAPGKGVAVTIGDNTVALFKVDGVVHAIEAWCLRCGTCLEEGVVDGAIVVCHGCSWRYDATTGSVVGIPALRLHVFDVEAVGGQLIISDA
jgi:nitrite reductase/ring-hydroxylating ferredoxin subunit